METINQWHKTKPRVLVGIIYCGRQNELEATFWSLYRKDHEVSIIYGINKWDQWIENFIKNRIYICEYANTGYTHMVNRFLSAALNMGYDWMTIYNDDILDINKGSIQSMIAEAHPHTAVIVPPECCLCGYKDSEQVWPHDAAYACAAIRVSAYAQVGGLDESLWWYHSDTDYNLKLEKFGWAVQCSKSFSIRHDFNVGRGCGNPHSEKLRLQDNERMDMKWGIHTWAHRDEMMKNVIKS